MAQGRTSQQRQQRQQCQQRQQRQQCQQRQQRLQILHALLGIWTKHFHTFPRWGQGKARPSALRDHVVNNINENLAMGFQFMPLSKPMIKPMIKPECISDGAVKAALSSLAKIHPGFEAWHSWVYEYSCEDSHSA